MEDRRVDCLAERVDDEVSGKCSRKAFSVARDTLSGSGKTIVRLLDAGNRANCEHRAGIEDAVRWSENFCFVFSGAASQT